MALWMWLPAVYTLDDPPLTNSCDMSFEIFLAHLYLTVFIGAGNNFARARCHVILLHKQNNIRALWLR